MVNQTTNYRLKKPDDTEFYDVKVFNDNADIIDQQLKENADATVPVNSLESVETNKSLAAAQGKILDGKIAQVNVSLNHGKLGINTDFRKGCIVNQRGLTTYDINSPERIIDMWSAWQANVAISDNGISIKRKVGTTQGSLNNIIETEFSQIVGKAMTLSLEKFDGTILKTTGVVATAGNSLIVVYDSNNSCIFIQPLAGKIEMIFSTMSDTATGISRIKLEFGNTSTLANDPPQDYGTELAKCQRYFQRYAINAGRLNVGATIKINNNNNAQIIMPLITEMRIVPTVSIVNPTQFRLFPGGAPVTLEQYFAAPYQNIFQINTSYVLEADYIVQTSDNSASYIDFSAEL